MNDILRLAAKEICAYLETALPGLSQDWWETNVIGHLSYHQQRIAQEKGTQTLDDLDLAALLRVLDQNWYELSKEGNLPRETRHWIKELQTVRNKWAHLPSHELTQNDIYRDADTIERLMKAINAPQETLDQIQGVKETVVQAMTTQANTKGLPVDEDITKQAADNAPSRHNPKFSVGDVVCLRSDPSQVIPIIEILEPVNTEFRYRVFQNNTKQSYYERHLLELRKILEVSEESGTLGDDG